MVSARENQTCEEGGFTVKQSDCDAVDLIRESSMILPNVGFMKR
jgi:hypothetical protein